MDRASSVQAASGILLMTAPYLQHTWVRQANVKKLHSPNFEHRLCNTLCIVLYM